MTQAGITGGLCSWCGFFIPVGMEHNCTSNRPIRDDILTEEHIAELEAQIQWDKERQAYLAAYRDETDRKLGEVEVELAVWKRALELACAGVRVIETHPAPEPWLELTLAGRVAHFVEQARKEMQP